jgi:hypothetical protein
VDLIFDLFGDAVPEWWCKRGRPQHIATNKNRNKVNMLLALGWNNERISKTLGITPPTLRKNYFRELKYRDDVRDKLEARQAMLLWDKCEAGNVAALKEFRKFLERNDLMKASALYGDGAQEKTKPEKKLKLGKKEQSNADAMEAGQDTIWGNDLKIAEPPRAH